MLGAQKVQAATQSCSPTGTITAGNYIIMANEWNSPAAQCITYTAGTAWTIDTANFNMSGGAPATYPAIYKGCHWGLCTPNSGLPIQVSALTSVTSSWSTVQTGSGTYDVAYDIWTNSTPTTIGQPDGTEIMIWINHAGGASPFGSQTATGTIAGYNWNIWTGRQTSWNIISSVLNPGATSVTNLDVLALMKDAVSRGSLRSTDYLIDGEAGFEVWQGGQGLGTISYSFDASSSSTPTPTPISSATPIGSASPTPITTASPTPPQTASPTPPSTITPPPTGGTGTCAATLHVENSWTGGFQATATVTAGSSAITGWTVNWTWPSGQSITNFWNATITSSGSAVTAKNAGYNGALGAGGNTTFGMQMNGSAVTPALSCTAAGGATPPPATATPPRTNSPTPPATATPPRTNSTTPPATGGAQTCSAGWHSDNNWTGAGER